MMAVELVLCFVLGCVLAELVLFVRRRRAVKQAQELRALYEHNFPGGCFECSFHEFGINHGYIKPGTLPDDHRCPERWDRWKGALHKSRR